jgi:exodeoxyribonuclease V alpha subunit
VHRFGGAIAALADAVRRGDAAAALGALRAGDDAVGWVPVDAACTGADRALAPVRAAAVEAGARVLAAARAGAAEEALAALGGFRVLCAHRAGPHGVAWWNATLEGWLASALPGFGAQPPWYLGRPLLVTRNDHGLGLYNGDTGVVVGGSGGGVRAVFAAAGGVVTLGPGRLEAVETVHAVTVHKAQGSQLDVVAVVLPGADSPILTRELLYTALTRARRRVIVVGPEDGVRAAVGRPIARASGLRARLGG